ncbi:MAG: hypothetical protein WCO75_06555 [Planctomycetota bacterium]
MTSQPTAGAERTVITDDRDRFKSHALIDVEPLARIPYDGHILPLISPDGRKAAIQSRSTASWAVRVGDPLPPDGFDCTIDVISLAKDAAGTPISTLKGQWILGRGADDEGYLVEGPRADGGRDIGLATWSGTVRIIAKDEWCNAFATVATNGTMAWCRRNVEGGDWQLVCERNGVRRVLNTSNGSSWLMPVFGGDGTGMFAWRLQGQSLVLAWLPFADDGLPADDATVAPEMLTVVSLHANLSWVVLSLEPVSGLAASPPGRERIAFFNPDAGRMALWGPGGRIEWLTEGSFAATVVDPGNALVTLKDSLIRERLATEPRKSELMTDGAWITRPTILSASELIGFRNDQTAMAFARMVVNPEAATSTGSPQQR